jgi:hypothetical protein
LEADILHRKNIRRGRRCHVINNLLDTYIEAAQKFSDTSKASIYCNHKLVIKTMSRQARAKISKLEARCSLTTMGNHTEPVMIYLGTWTEAALQALCCLGQS